MLKNIKLLFTGLVIGTLLIAGTVALADRPVKIFLDGNEMPNADAMIIEGRTYVPLRVISEALGVEVNWDESQWAVKLKRNFITTEPDRPLDLAPIKPDESQKNDNDITREVDKRLTELHDRLNILQSLPFERLSEGERQELIDIKKALEQEKN